MLVDRRVILRPFRRTDLESLYDLVADGREIGYRIDRPGDRGKGYMTEAIRLATAYLFGQEPIERVQIVLDPRNEGSRRVAERTGYTLEGTLRSAHFDRGESLDLLLFSILRSEAPPLSELLAPLDDERYVRCAPPRANAGSSPRQRRRTWSGRTRT